MSGAECGAGKKDLQMLMPSVFSHSVPSPWAKARWSSSRSSNSSTPRSMHATKTAKSDAEEEFCSTPPTEEGEAEQDGFFSLDVDLDLDKLDLNGKEAPTTTISSPLTRPVQLAPEPDSLGNLEYKLRILPPTRHRYDRLLTQLKWRLLQGGACCTYEIGVLDDGRCIGICPTEMRASLRVLASLASELGASVRVRRAFVLAESPLPLEQGGSNELHTMINEDARRMLLTDSVRDTTLPSCSCLAVEDVLSYSEAATMRNSTGAHALDVYEVQVDEACEDGSAGSWLGGSDCSDTRQDAEDMDNNSRKDGSEDGATFSLSLDEMATRQAIGQQRRYPQRRCRYQAKGALLRRQKDAAMQMPGTATSGPLPMHQLASDVLAPSDDAAVTAPACERVIVEAVVSKAAEDEHAQDFIDYASL